MRRARCGSVSAWATPSRRGIPSCARRSPLSIRDCAPTTCWCSAALSEALALTALRAREVLLARSRAILQENLSLLERLTAAHADLLSWARPQGGRVALAKLHCADVESYCATLAERAGVLLLPGVALDWPAPYVRLGYGRRGVGAALAAWERALDA